MSMTNSFAASILQLIFQAQAIANLAQNGTSPLTNLYISLHTTSPGVTGNQTTNEAAYTSYARVAVARTSGGFSISGETISPVSTIVFPSATGGSETETYMGIGSASSGTGVLYLFGSISPTIAVATGVTPELTTSTAITAS